jgi:hypothetical protein
LLQQGPEPRPSSDIEIVDVFGQFLFGAALQCVEHRTFQIGIHDRGMYVAFAADGWSVAEFCRDAPRSAAHQVLFGLCLRIEFLEFPQC